MTINDYEGDKPWSYILIKAAASYIAKNRQLNSLALCLNDAIMVLQYQITKIINQHQLRNKATEGGQEFGKMAL